MESKSNDLTHRFEGLMPHQPPFPFFPIVCPLIFPIGFVAMLMRAGRRRRAALMARIAALEEKVERLTAESRPPE